MKWTPILVGAVISFAAASAEAAPITNTIGLLTPDNTITFGEVPLADNTPLTTQFSGSGVTFAGLFADTTLNRLAPPDAQNFQGGTASYTPFDIFFTSPVAGAAFQMITNTGLSTFQALLNGGLVESFATVTFFPLITEKATYYGFEDIVFDQVHVIPAVGGVNSAAGIDNIEFSLASQAVPEPAMLVLFGAGAMATGMRNRWRSSSPRGDYTSGHRP